MNGTPDDEGGRVIFAGPRRNLADTENAVLVSVGVDIGSSTTHLVFSRVRMEQRDGRYIVADRAVIFDSEILLTPYADADTIDADALGAFIADQYAAASLTPDDIDTGALILTGVAVRRQNARAIGELFAIETGKFVSVSAGDHLEAVMAAHGSGATLNSALVGATVMNVDIGGGTSKIAICAQGRIVDLTAIDIGARLVAFDATGRVLRIEPAGKLLADALGLDLAPGRKPPDGAAETLADLMADRLMEIVTLGALTPETASLLRLPAIAWRGRIDALTFSGGVAEYLYGYDETPVGDLGPALARAVRERAEAAGFRIMEPVESIRATVVGASQYAIQLSGSTIYVSDEDALPLRNLPVIRPEFELEDEAIDSNSIVRAISAALARLDLADGEKPVALCFDWRGSASYARMHDFLSGVLAGLTPALDLGHPLVLVCEGDIGRVFGLHAAENFERAGAIVSIDGIALEEFDFIDIGAPLPGSGAVPVVIKSLLFPTAAAPGTPDGAPEPAGR